MAGVCERGALALLSSLTSYIFFTLPFRYEDSLMFVEDKLVVHVISLPHQLHHPYPAKSGIVQGFNEYGGEDLGYWRKKIGFCY